MTPEQRKRDEEAALNFISDSVCTCGCTEFSLEDFKKMFIGGLNHCRETEVKELRELCDKMSLNSLKIEIERDEFREQLRVAVEIIEIAKAFVHQDKDNICKECDPEDHKYGWACRFAKALQKIEAMKGGGDAKT